MYFLSLPFSYMTALSTFKNLFCGKKFYKIERIFFVLELKWKKFLIPAHLKYSKVSEYFTVSHSNTN